MKTTVLVASALAMALSAVATAPMAAEETEQCYGVAKAGMNDCKAGAHDCAGMTTEDKDPASFVLLPKGLCERVNGGSTTPRG